MMYLFPSARVVAEGNVFTSVCHSFCPQEGGLPRGGGSAKLGLDPGGSTSGGVLPQGGLNPELGWADPFHHQILRDTVNERAVHILLECILVSEVISLHEVD